MPNDNLKFKSERKIAIILINYRDYAKKYLKDCIDSIKSQKCDCSFNIFIVDNETSQESYNILREITPEAEIIRNLKNDGFAKGNNGAIRLAINRGFDYIVLFNMDTIIDKSCLSNMVEQAEADEKVGAVQARLMLWPDKEKINSLGNITHFLGFGYCLGYDEEIEKYKFKIKNSICYPSGAAVLFKTQVLKNVGLFDEVFWMYNEDQDLGWRIWLAGYKCVLASKAVVYHKYEFSRSIKKYYWLDRNRILSVLKNYRFFSIILILPAFIIMEFGLLFFSFSNSWLKEKLKVYQYFLKLENWRDILNKRKKVQKLRKVRDKEIIKMFSGEIWYQEISGKKLKIANYFFSAYWRIIKFLIRW